MTNFILLKPELSQETRDATYILANGLDLDKEPHYEVQGTISTNRKETLTLNYKGLTYAQKEVIVNDFDLKKTLGSIYVLDQDNDLILIDEEIKKFYIENIRYSLEDAENWSITLELKNDIS